MPDRTWFLDSIIRNYSESRDMDPDEVRSFFDANGIIRVLQHRGEYGHMSTAMMMDDVRDMILRACGIYHPFVPWAVHRFTITAPEATGEVVTIFAEYTLGGRMISGYTVPADDH